MTQTADKPLLRADGRLVQSSDYLVLFDVPASDVASMLTDKGLARSADASGTVTLFVWPLEIVALLDDQLELRALRMARFGQKRLLKEVGAREFLLRATLGRGEIDGARLWGDPTSGRLIWRKLDRYEVRRMTTPSGLWFRHKPDADWRYLALPDEILEVLEEFLKAHEVPMTQQRGGLRADVDGAESYLAPGNAMFFLFAAVSAVIGAMTLHDRGLAMLALPLVFLAPPLAMQALWRALYNKPIDPLTQRPPSWWSRGLTLITLFGCVIGAGWVVGLSMIGLA
ncbi:MAG: hypothetical protein H6684_14830 [Deltaproteobacteria bacterium]|nr:hypothetical protein [Deltaproteobacteria bacterium]MCB9490005.1 hypothetical protein [Deltaproteobacteria bacterium]